MQCVLFVFLSFYLGLVVSRQHPGIYWNKTSESFRLDTNDHIIDVDLNDDIDIYCPYYPTPTPESDMEYYVIYQVTEVVYNDCNLRNSQPLKVLNCSAPRKPIRATLLFIQYSAIPNAPEFKPGNSYYFITTSTGSKYGMDNPLNGACQKYQMKVKFNVCCTGDTKPTAVPSIVTAASTAAPTTQPPKPIPTTQPKPQGIKPVKGSENETAPKDERRVSDNASRRLTSCNGLLLCSLLLTLRFLSWLHCR